MHVQAAAPRHTLSLVLVLVLVLHRGDCPLGGGGGGCHAENPLSTCGGGRLEPPPPSFCAMALLSEPDCAPAVAFFTAAPPASRGAWLGVLACGGDFKRIVASRHTLVHRLPFGRGGEENNNNNNKRKKTHPTP